MKRKILKFISFLGFLIIFITCSFNGSVQFKQTEIKSIQDSTKYQIRNNLIYMESETFIVNLNPATLETTLTRRDQSNDKASISQKVFNRKNFKIYLADQSILYPRDNLKITFHLDKNMLRMTFSSLKPQVVKWPSILMKKKSTSLIWPYFEGNYVPLNDIIWIDFLKSRGWNTTEDLYMPFWGVERGQQLLTYLVENPFHNKIVFNEKNDDFQIDLTHTFPNNSDLSKPITVRVYLDYNTSPITPAKHFRQYLKDRNDFVTLQDKIKTATLVSRLIGASHAYIWDGAPITIADIKKDAWIPLAKAIVKQAASENLTAGKQIMQALSPEKGNFDYMSQQTTPYLYLQKEMVDSLSKVLYSSVLYNKLIWPITTLPVQYRNIAERIINKENVCQYELVQLNSQLIYSSFAEYLNEPFTWGNGVSTRMIDALSKDGMDRFVLTCDGIENLDIRPNIASYAKEKGYLIGPYDDYHGVQNPDAPEWPTGIFDRTLYETGRIMQDDSTPVKGFMGVGYMLSPIAAKPYFDERVGRNFQKVPSSYYFLDCDAYGEFFDDYHPGRVVSVSENVGARVDRVRSIFKKYKIPVGSEGGSYLFTGSLAVAEGVFFPTILGDPDMEINEMSRYFLGRFFPTDEPEIFFLPALLKDKYIRLYSDPRFRLPLYETVFHDSVITTSHYSSPSLKFLNIAQTTALTEILYQVAPMYHFNLSYFQKVKTKIKDHIKVFEKTHSYSYRYALEEFDYISSDRNVQKTRFGDLELIANFKEKDYNFMGINIPSKSILIIFKNSNESFIYQSPVFYKHNKNLHDIPLLIKNLSNTEWEKRRQAAIDISLIGVSAKKSIPILIKSLFDEEWQVRKAAARALANMEDAAIPAIPALIKTLKDEEWQVRKAAIYALVILGNKAKPAVPFLIEALDDEEWQIRKPAALALGSIGAAARKAIPALKAKLNDPELQVRIAVEMALKKIH